VMEDVIRIVQVGHLEPAVAHLDELGGVHVPELCDEQVVGYDGTLAVGELLVGGQLGQVARDVRDQADGVPLDSTR